MWITSMMDRFENLPVVRGKLIGRVPYAAQLDRRDSVRITSAQLWLLTFNDRGDVHGVQGRTPALVDCGIDCLYYAALAEASIPSLLVEINACGVHQVKGVRVADVQLIGRNPNDGTWKRKPRRIDIGQVSRRPIDRLWDETKAVGSDDIPYLS
jgi:hypothetical protein